MRLRSSVLLLALGFLAPDGAAGEELLASFAETVQGTDTGHDYFDYGDVDLVLGDDLARLFDDAGTGPTQTPVLFEATPASDPAFATVAELFTNGEPDEFVIELTGASGGGLGVGSNDCGLFHGEYECSLGVDLQGGTIERVTLEVRQLALEPIDPLGTAIVFEVALQVFGTPEPAGALPGAVAAATLAFLRQRRRASAGPGSR
jgi:hypothetical protein